MGVLVFRSPSLTGAAIVAEQTRATTSLITAAASLPVSTPHSRSSPANASTRPKFACVVGAHTIYEGPEPFPADGRYFVGTGDAQVGQRRHHTPQQRHRNAARHSDAHLSLLQSSIVLPSDVERPSRTGAADRNRTRNLLFTKQLLCQLSYGGAQKERTSRYLRREFTDREAWTTGPLSLAYCWISGTRRSRLPGCPHLRNHR